MKIAWRTLDIIVVPALAVALWFALFYAPREATMGDVYRIFYFHVPAAAASFVGFAVVFVCSVQYLRFRDLRYDAVAAAAAESGVVFSGLGIAMGMLWAKPVWGGFWIPGDIHLLATAILFLVYVAYLMMRSAIEDRVQRATLSAGVGVMGIIGVPIVYFSNRVIHVGNHPVLLSLTPAMSQAFMVCMVTMLLLYVVIARHRAVLALGLLALQKQAAGASRLSPTTPGTGIKVVAGMALRVTAWEPEQLDRDEPFFTGADRSLRGGS